MKIIRLAVMLVIAFLILISVSYFQTSNTPTPARNFEGEFKMGLIPNAESRQPFSNDNLIARVSDGKNTYGLYQSNHLETKDLGKIFLWRIS